MQDLLILPLRAQQMDEALEICVAVYEAAVDLIAAKYGARRLTADEGGLAPPFFSCEAMFEDALLAIESAGYRPGEDVGLALDVAASQFWRDGRYQLEGELESAAMVALLADWSRRWPVSSVEDGLAEEDWAHWPALKRALGGRALTLGDDLLCTNPARIRRAIEADAADALLLKVNQIGTLSEAAAACQLARDAGWHVTVSARSGETEDNWLADLAVGWSGDAHQDWLDHTVGAAGQVQSPAGNRLTSAGCRWQISRLPGWPHVPPGAAPPVSIISTASD